MTPTRIVADILLGGILVALVIVSFLCELAAWYEHRPYRRDTKRAAAIRQHSLLKMSAQQWLSEVGKLVDKEMEKRP